MQDFSDIGILKIKISFKIWILLVKMSKDCRMIHENDWKVFMILFKKTLAAPMC